MRMEIISIGGIVRDNSCSYPCLDKVVGIRHDKSGTMYKMCASGLYVPSEKVERVCFDSD